MKDRSVDDIMDSMFTTTDELDKFTGEPIKQRKLVTTTTLREEVHEFNKNGFDRGFSLGFHNTDSGFKLREHEITILSGTNGSGKTMWLSHVCLNQLLADRKCMIASLEMHPVLTINRMVMQFLESNNPTPQFVDEFINKMEDKLWIYKQDGVTTTQNMLDLVLFAYHVHGCQIMVIDSLMKMNDIAEDNYEAQKRFIDNLTALTRQMPIHIFLVAHTRKTKDIYEQPTKNDVHGSNHIVNLCDNLLCVWRNKWKEKQAQEEKLTMLEMKTIPDVKVFVQKQRNYIGENSEPTFNFFYDKKGLRYKEKI